MALKIEYMSVEELAGYDRNEGTTDYRNLEAANDPIFIQKQRA